MRTVAVSQNFTTVPGVDECDTVSLCRECTHPEDNLDADAEGSIGCNKRVGPALRSPTRTAYMG